MRDLSVKLILLVNRLVPATPVHLELAEAKRTVRAYQQWEYREIERIYKDFEPYWDLEGKTVLDIGCGLGGKLLFYAQQGAKEVVGIDLRSFSAASTGRLATEQGHGEVIRIAVADGAELPFADDAFDVVISINVLEHVAVPLAVLRECRRVLRPGGRLYLHFPPFYSPWGPHLDGWINFPWPHLLFSERSLVRAAALVEEQERHNERFIPPARVHWDKLEGFYELNRLTIHRFSKLVRETDLQILQCRLLPFGRHVFRRGVLGKFVLALLRSAARAPLLNEVVVTKIATVMTK